MLNVGILRVGVHACTCDPSGRVLSRAACITICSQIPTRRLVAGVDGCPCCKQLVACSNELQKQMCFGSKPRSGALSHELIWKQSCITMVLMILFFCVRVCVLWFLFHTGQIASGAFLHFRETAAAEWLVGRQGERQACGWGKCTCTVHLLPLPLPLPPSLPDSFPKWSQSMASWSGSPGIV